MRLTAAACLSDNVRLFYADGQKIFDSDKTFLKNSVVDSITNNHDLKPVADTYAQILEKVVAFDFPDRWRDMPSMILNKLINCNRVEELYGSLTAINILVKTITLVANKDEEAIDEFVCQIFPKLEVLLNNQVNDLMNNPSEHTAQILFLVFKCFLSVVTVEIPGYLDIKENENSFNLWMSALQAVLFRNLPENLTSHLESWTEQLDREQNIEWKLKRVVVQIINW